jgi:hypothetical protein
MAIIPGDFEQQIERLISVLDAAARDPNSGNMKAAKDAYANGKTLIASSHATTGIAVNLDPELDKMATCKRRFEAAANRLRQSLRDRDLLDEEIAK